MNTSSNTNFHYLRVDGIERIKMHNNNIPR